MSAAEGRAGESMPGSGRPWKLWASQALSVCRLELRRNFAGRRDVGIYLLALIPVGLFGLLLLMPTGRQDPFRGAGFAGMLYAGVYQTFMLRICFYFGLVWVFMNLFRGDMLDRSLHYYFLTPVRREVLVVGKYLSGLTTTGLLFGFSTVASFLLLRMRGMAVAPEGTVGGPPLDQLFWYLLVTELACVGYGAVFLLMGLLLRNPIVPALAIFGWEMIIFLLPPFLKRISVAYYLQSLCPIQLRGGDVEFVAEPSSPEVAIPGIVILTMVLLVLSALRVRRMEISYAGE